MKVLLLVFVGFLSLSLNPPTAEEKVKNSIIELLNTDDLKYASLSFCMFKEDGSIFIEHESQRALTPASNLKLITTAAALDILKDTFRFETQLGYTGRITQEGILEGNLIIKGDGDPSLGSKRYTKNNPNVFQIWMDEVQKLGIKKINGSIYADPGAFDLNTIPDGWIWTDIGNYFGAGASGLNINDNTFNIVFAPGKSEGDSARIIRTEPDLSYLTFINNMKTGKPGSGDNGNVYGGILSNNRYLAGTVPSGCLEFPIKASIPDPAYFVAYTLYNNLKKRGIEITGKYANSQLERYTYTDFKKVIGIRSPELVSIVKETNYESINLFAEALLNRLGYENYKFGSVSNGLTVVKDWLTKNDIDNRQVFMYDGSGLSLTNAVTTQSFCKLLHVMKSNKGFVSSLPIAGVSGTLSSICKGTSAQDKILAKSGSFKKTLGYSGYLKSKNGKLLPFSVIINNYSGNSVKMRSRIEKLMIVMTEI